MQTIIFNQNQDMPEDTRGAEPGRLQWIDLERSDTLSRKDLPVFLARILHDNHLKDLGNALHPPYFDCTSDYEMLIFRAVEAGIQVLEPKTRSTVFLLIENTVVTIHDKDDATLMSLHKKWRAGTQKHPRDILGLLHSLLDVIGNTFLGLREPLNEQVQFWQQKLLDPNDPFADWQVFMNAKSSLRNLNVNLELQREVLQKWRDETQYTFSQSDMIRFNDFDGHLARIERLSDAMRSDIDALVEIYFATTGQKTNMTMQFLAVISAIFLPLNLVAGLFGMNFEHMPVLREPWGFTVVITAMLALAGLLLWWFKKNRWF